MEQLKAIFTSKTFYLSAGSILAGGIVFALVLDSILMPWYTNYNQGVTVPDVTKLSLEEAETILDEYGLRHEVLDRRTHSAYPANYIIDQAPSPKQIVKPNRKIYLTINTADIPQTVVPGVVDMSLRNARIQLENHGLMVGTTSYESGRFRNTILRQSVAAGDTVDRGTVVNLAVSDGLGTRLVPVPDVTGLHLTEAQQEITRAGLRVGDIDFRPSRDVAPYTVLSYSPDEEELTEGEVLSLVVAERHDAREESEEGVIVDDTTSTSPPPPVNDDNYDHNEQNELNER